MSAVKTSGRVGAVSLVTVLVICATSDGRPTFATWSRRYQSCQSLKQPFNTRIPERLLRHIVARIAGNKQRRDIPWVSLPLSIVHTYRI